MKKVLEDCVNELRLRRRRSKATNSTQDKRHEEVIQVMKEIINKQAAEIEHLKRDNMKEKDIPRIES